MAGAQGSAQRRIKSITYSRYGYYFILPFFLVYILFQLVPLANTFVIAFYGNTDTAGSTADNRDPNLDYIDQFVGFDNLQDILVGETTAEGEHKVYTMTFDYQLIYYYFADGNPENTSLDNIVTLKGGAAGPIVETAEKSDEGNVIPYAVDGTGKTGGKESPQVESKAELNHKSFFRTLGNTLILWFGNFIPQVLLSLLLAVWFTDAKIKIKGKGFFKVIMYLPNIITAASVAALFKSLLDDTMNYPGPINEFVMNIAGRDPKADAPFSFVMENYNQQLWLPRASVMFIQTWLWFGNTMLMLMSGIMGINKSLFEAADIDGANSWQSFWHITLPLLRPIMLYTLVTSMIGGLQMFDIPLLYRVGTTMNNVNKQLETVAIFIYSRFLAPGGATANLWGYAGAASVVLFILTSILGAIAFYINRDKDAIAKKKQIKKLEQQRKQKAKKVQLGGYSGL